MLLAFRERAARYDAENSFCEEDFNDLREIGYLKLAVPSEFGGGGATLAELCEAQRTLGRYAPATALAVNMHLYWSAMAAELRKLGDASLDWILEETAAGEVFAAGHAESGSDLPGMLSTATARRVEGGYEISGHKMFGSLSPVWTRLGVWAQDSDAEGGPQIVHGTVCRGDAGYRVVDTWDTMGMRATSSQDTILDGVFVSDDRVMRVIPAGGQDEFMLCLFAVFPTTLCSVYLGLAERAFELALEAARSKTSIALTRSMAYHPEVQHALSNMVLDLEAAGAQLTLTTADWSNGVDHGDAWGLKLISLKQNVTAAARRVVDEAAGISGGAAFYKRNELERLARDVYASRFHPPNAAMTSEMLAKMVLGIEFLDQPRWG